MKTLIQRVEPDANQSFACRVYETPQFETNWHKHPEYELITILKGHGTALIGDHVCDYKVNDVFFIAGNLPHWFRKHHPKMNCAVLVVHFTGDCWGEGLLQMPEMKTIQALLKKNNGILLQKRLKKEMQQDMHALHTAKGFEKLLLLFQCLHKLSASQQYKILAADFHDPAVSVNPAIEKIIDYSFKHFLEPITLEEIAAVANMTIPTFCRFFRKNIKKTYFEFIRDLRISHACKLLTTTSQPILEVCYESGYKSWAHFSKQFKEVKQQTPSQFRRQFMEGFAV
ncbi:helix-turn-helix domain-containing protein [Pseudoflavitalea sp. X16]|uniref:AraC family transcriptional regulator n=1 Tax=Paraflavitalea devenefica TaxID=2716334 RepID=UPI00141E4537|nr:AraC family transcriptional regulator [Paraflavitalea devenefica]NII26484.1 helix-turn-helix domain-containing protein [Paraflavitalea devenefica]